MTKKGERLCFSDYGTNLYEIYSSDVSMDEIIISRHFLNGSFNSDRVRVQPFYSNYLNQSKGKVVKILKRFSSNFIAIVYKKKDTWYANVDINQPKNIRIEDTKIVLKQFDVVEITMVNWNNLNRLIT